MKRIHQVLIFGLPLIWLIGFLLLFLWARAEVGHWPSADNPDPKTLSSWWLRELLMWGLVAVGVGMLVGIGLQLVETYKKKTIRSLIWLIYCLITTSAFFLFVRLDPYLIFDWFSD